MHSRILYSNTEICIGVSGGIEVKTTLDIDDELLVKAKALSARERKSLTTLIEEGLRLRLRRRSPSSAARYRPLPVYKGKGGLAKGIDPTSNRSMLEAADGDT